MTKLSFAFASALTLMSIAACKKKAGDGGGAGDATAKMTEYKDKMCACKDADCAKKVSDEMTAWTASFSKSQGDKKLGEADQKRTTELGTQMGECMMKLIGTGSAGSADATAAAAGADPAAGSGSEAAGNAMTESVPGLPKQCDDYKAAIDKLATCEAMPKEARETLVKAYTDAAAGWKALPDAAKEKIGVSCEAGAKAVISTASGPCGWK
jgi:hypothetical protein